MAFERPDLGFSTAVELKYITRSWRGDVKGQEYNLKNQSAHDNGRCVVVKDTPRVEEFGRIRTGSNGAVIALTNDERYYSQSTGSTASDAVFRIGEGVVLEGSASGVVRPQAPSAMRHWSSAAATRCAGLSSRPLEVAAVCSSS